MKRRLDAVSSALLSLALLLSASPADARPKPSPASTPEARWQAWEQHKKMQQSSPFRALEWRSIGPTGQGGRVVDIAMVPSHPERYYVAYATGGVWRTDNDGGSFTALTDQLPNTVTGALALDPQNSDTLWVGAGEPNAARSNYGGFGVFVSKDGGKSFSHKGLTSSDRIAAIVIDPRDSQRVLVAAAGKLYSPGGERGVYLSEDGGDSWRQVLKPDNDWTGASDLVIDPSNPDVLYAALWERKRTPWEFSESGAGSGVYKSNDAGKTWQRLSGFPRGELVGRIGLALAPSQPGRLYASMDHWQQLPDALRDLGDRPLAPARLATMSKEEFLRQDPDEVERFIRGADLPVKLDAKDLLAKLKADEISLDQLRSRLADANAALFDAPIWGLTIWRSDDAGDSWQRTHDTPISNVTYTYGYYFGEIAVDPANGDRVYTMGVPLIVSEDGGKHWQGYTNHPSVHVDHHALWIDPNRPQRMFLGNDGGLDVSQDGGHTWRRIDAQPVGQFYTIWADMKTPYNVYGGLQDNGTRKGSSETRWELGEDWSTINGGDGMYVATDEAGNTYSGYQFGYYTRISSEGKRSEVRPRAELDQPPLRFNWSTPVMLSPHDPDTVYVGANRLYRSFDQGQSWQPISPDLSSSKNRGNVPFATITSVDESQLQPGLLLVGTDDGRVQLSEDGGHRWRPIDGDLPADRWVSRVILSQHASSRLYVGLNGYRQDDDRVYLYASDDLGKRWRDIGSGLPAEPINVIREDPVNQDVLYVGSDRGVYLSLDRGKTWQALDGGLPNVPVHDLFVHPRDRELIAGTHGRSAWVLDVLPIQQLDVATRKQAVQLFHIDQIKGSRDWRREADPWFDRAAYLPSLSGSFWSRDGGAVRFRLLDSNEQPLATFKREAVTGLNSFAWDLLIDSELALAAEARALEKVDEDKRELLQHHPYAESLRLGHRLYPVPGKYQLEISQGEATHQVALTIKPPKAWEPRWEPPFKLRGKDDDGRSQPDPAAHPRAGSRGRPFSIPGK